MTRRNGELSYSAQELKQLLRDHEAQRTAQRADLERSAAALAADLDTARAECAAVRAELTRAQQAHGSAAAQVAALETREEGLQRQVEAERGRAAEAKQRWEEVQASRETLRSRLVDAEEAAAAAVAALEKAAQRAQQGGGTGRLAAALEALEQERGRAVASEEGRRAAEAEVGLLQEAVAQAGAALVQMKAELDELRLRWREQTARERSWREGVLAPSGGAGAAHDGPMHVRSRESSAAGTAVAAGGAGGPGGGGERVQADPVAVPQPGGGLWSAGGPGLSLPAERTSSDAMRNSLAFPVRADPPMSPAHQTQRRQIDSGVSGSGHAGRMHAAHAFSHNEGSPQFLSGSEAETWGEHPEGTASRESWSPHSSPEAGVGGALAWRPECASCGHGGASAPVMSVHVRTPAPAHTPTPAVAHNTPPALVRTLALVRMPGCCTSSRSHEAAPTAVSVAGVVAWVAAAPGHAIPPQCGGGICLFSLPHGLHDSALTTCCVPMIQYICAGLLGWAGRSVERPRRSLDPPSTAAAVPLRLFRP